MNNPSKSSPESPAKEQPGEQKYGGHHYYCAALMHHEDGSYSKDEGQCDCGYRKPPSAVSQVAAPDVAAMVRRLNTRANFHGTPGGIYGYTGDVVLLREAAALLEKLGQRWIPVEWQELGGVPGPENEPAALVAWISVAQKEGVEELFRRMQKRLLLWEREKLSPETYEKIKNWSNLHGATPTGAPMTDLELTKACAEAMGYQTAMRETPFTERGVKILFAAPYDDPQWQVYNPLHNDDQAMALVRKFRLQIDPHDDHWNVAAVGKAASLREDLNRAIVECVAKLKERP